MLRVVLPLLLAFHGLIHLVGFVVPFRLVDVQEYPYSTTAAWGRIELGAQGARLLGVAWLLNAAAFALAAAGTWWQAAWATPLTVAAAALSLLLCVAGAPAAAPGLAVNVALLAGLAVMYWTGHGLR
jgi:hypothetical protein